MSDNRRRIGAWGEKVARDYLEKLGYQICETNFRRREGEIDIIARDGEYLVFVEVRTKRGSGFGSPEESITFSKREKLASLANVYLQTHENLPPLWRIDVVAVELAAGEISRVELIKSAIGEP